MLKVPTSIGTSPIHGIGLFAKEPIAKGTVVWEFTEGMDRYITDEQLLKLPQDTLDFVYFYFFRSKCTGQYALLADNDRFTNHSYEPNVSGPEVFDYRFDGGIALRDIEAGEEITNDYSMFDVDFHIYEHCFPREQVLVPVRMKKPRTRKTARHPVIGRA